jgi:hypothetical protein
LLCFLSFPGADIRPKSNNNYYYQYNTLSGKKQAFFIGLLVSFSQNPVGFGKSSGKSVLKAAFSSQSKVAFPKTEVLGKPLVIEPVPKPGWF